MEKVQATSAPYDFCIIGGGATGLGAAVDAAARGYSVLLVERGDFAQGTSARSTKLVHGGVRYLQQGNIALVREALRERGRMARNAPHLVKETAFIIPGFHYWQIPFYGLGMKVYDLLAGRLGLSPSRILNPAEVKRRLPTIAAEKLCGGVVYSDGQFDDARMAINLARTATEAGAHVLNYVRCTGLLKDHGKVSGVSLNDGETGGLFEVRAKSVINATGVFVDDLRSMEDPAGQPMVLPSQGIHFVLPRRFLPGEDALMIPKTSDGRVLFAIPWCDHVILGTTDTPVGEVSAEPRALPEEITFLLEHAARYLSCAPQAEDVLSVFAGLRPLVRPPKAQRGNTATISRDHTITVGPGGMVSITGGKWTSYRKMAADVVEVALQARGQDAPPCGTESLRIHGWTDRPAPEPRLRHYGADAEAIRALGEEEKIHPAFDLTVAEVRWFVREEMARTVEDVLLRRSHCLLFDARQSTAAAPRVAQIMAAELRRDTAWEEAQVIAYRRTAENYFFPLPGETTPAPAGPGPAFSAR
jgi:glycerol-3-phosphate dehydrogenase